ncbi:MAG: GNAT family N-acetyltransferase [Treponema sp.]|jgi:spermidine synthase|nr:GNAT family N-acetyltransferase [Treponema sp.]
MRQLTISGVDGIVKVEPLKAASLESADIHQIINLYKEPGWWSESDNDAPDSVQKIIQGSFCFVVATLNGKIIGIGRAISDGFSDAYIQDVTVTGDFRGKGIAVLIVDELVEYLTSKNIGWIALISEPKAVSFYRRYGFSQMENYVPFQLK